MMRGPLAASDFYTILPAGGDTVDVILRPPAGGLYILRGLPNDPGLEADVRMRYSAYLSSAFPMEGSDTHADKG